MNNSDFNMDYIQEGIVGNKHRLIPSINDYYSNLNTFTLITLIVGSLIFLIINVIFLKTLNRLPKITLSSIEWRTKILCGIYPFISLLALISLLVPAYSELCNSLMHVAFTICAYHFYVLCFLYVNGEDEFLKVVDPQALSIRTPPCCCCCTPCIPMAVTKKRISILHYMILQLPCIQSSIVIALDVIYFVEIKIYDNVSLYFAPFITISILIGIWSLNIAMRMIRPYATNQSLLRKYISIQLVLIVCKLQYVILDAELDAIDFGGFYPLTNFIYKQAIINLAILFEMLLLSLLAKKAYEKPST